MDSNLRREIIMDNYQDPMNRGLIDDDSYLKVNTNSESCIDNLDYMMKIDDGKIIDIRFDGEACAISTSATSIMIRSLIGKSIEEAKTICDNYNLDVFTMLSRYNSEQEIIKLFFLEYSSHNLAASCSHSFLLNCISFE